MREGADADAYADSGAVAGAGASAGAGKITGAGVGAFLPGTARGV